MLCLIHTYLLFDLGETRVVFHHFASCIYIVRGLIQLGERRGTGFGDSVEAASKPPLAGTWEGVVDRMYKTLFGLEIFSGRTFVQPPPPWHIIFITALFLSLRGPDRNTALFGVFNRVLALRFATRG